MCGEIGKAEMWGRDGDTSIVSSICSVEWEEFISFMREGREENLSEKGFHHVWR
jgi:hypothetical protein